VAAGEPQSVLVGCEHNGLDHLGAELSRLRQPAQVQLLAEAAPAVAGKVVDAPPVQQDGVVTA
jgi:hypothetical protein